MLQIRTTNAKCPWCGKNVEVIVPPDLTQPVETQQSIGAWQVETFGRFVRPFTGLTRLMDEVRELAEAVPGPDFESVAREMADVEIVLRGWAEQMGIDLQAEVDKKMQINRSRRWATNGDGTGQHIKEE